MLKEIGKTSLVVCICLGTLNAAEVEKRNDSVRASIDKFAKVEAKDVSEVDKIKKMFSEGKASGQLRIMYAGEADVGGRYATTIGGIIKYELAEYHGFNAGAAVYTSFDITALSGKDAKRNPNISSSQGDYTEMGEAYLNYRYENFNIRGGRQTINTPLADTDDVRMVQNSFEAYIATYDLNGVEFMLGNLQKWQGTGVGLDNGWEKTGENGTNLIGVAYADGLEFQAWYYNITGETNAAYFDIGIEKPINDDVLVHVMAQYMNQSEIDGSGVGASIYGVLAEVVVHGVGLNIAVNKADKKDGQESFAGFGGGALFTNMDTMTIDSITKDREALSYVLAIVYSYEDFEFLYAYGDFNGDNDSNGDKAHVVEQNIALGYNFEEEFVVGIMYVNQDDKLNHSNDWNRLQVMANYNF